MRLGLSIPDELVGRVDAARGDVPRSRFVQRALEAALGIVQAARELEEYDLLEELEAASKKDDSSGSPVPVAPGSSTSPRAPEKPEPVEVEQTWKNHPIFGR